MSASSALSGRIRRRSTPRGPRRARSLPRRRPRGCRNRWRWTRRPAGPWTWGGSLSTTWRQRRPQSLQRSLGERHQWTGRPPSSSRERSTRHGWSSSPQAASGRRECAVPPGPVRASHRPSTTPSCPCHPQIRPEGPRSRGGWWRGALPRAARRQVEKRRAPADALAGGTAEEAPFTLVQVTAPQ